MKYYNQQSQITVYTELQTSGTLSLVTSYGALGHMPLQVLEKINCSSQQAQLLQQAKFDKCQHVLSSRMFKQSPHPPAQITSNLNARNSVHSAAAAILTVKISKLTKEKHVLHFHLSCQKHAKTHVNRLKQSRN